MRPAHSNMHTDSEDCSNHQTVPEADNSADLQTGYCRHKEPFHAAEMINVIANAIAT